MIVHRDNPDVRPFFELCFGKRPAEELYDVREDPHQMVNLLEVRPDPNAGPSIDYEEIAAELANRLDEYLKMTGDTRVGHEEPIWDTLPQYEDTSRTPRGNLPEALKELLPGHDLADKKSEEQS